MTPAQWQQWQNIFTIAVIVGVTLFLVARWGAQARRRREALDAAENACAPFVPSNPSQVVEDTAKSGRRNQHS